MVKIVLITVLVNHTIALILHKMVSNVLLTVQAVYRIARIVL